MPTTVVDIYYQTRRLPPPYSYRYALLLQPKDQALRVRLEWTYTDRDELTEEDIEAEGFSANDDFFWEGALPVVWTATLHDLLRETRWVPENTSNDSSLRVMVTRSSEEVVQGSPHDHPEWEYFLQETIQAVYEAAQRERPLRLAYLNFQKDRESVELRWEASFLTRTLILVRITDGVPQERTVPWPLLRPLLQAWYVPDYDPEKAEASIPRLSGEYADPGDGRWHQFGKAVTNPGKPDTIGNLRVAIRRFEAFLTEENQ